MMDEGYRLPEKIPSGILVAGENPVRDQMSVEKRDQGLGIRD
jgi:hypothetical protein